ncbi:MAG: Si-specific NAD(P)(+) transhydrogenase [Pseudomonadota bacterium]
MPKKATVSRIEPAITVADADQYDLVIVGSGPGGRRAAIQAAKLGRRVAVIEKRRRVGGVSVHTGTIPSKTMRETVLNLTGWREREFYGRTYRVKQSITASDLLHRLRRTLDHEVEIQEHQFMRNHVDTVCGVARFVDTHTLDVGQADGNTRRLRGEKILLAVGTEPFRPDSIPFDGSTVIDSDELLSLDRIPASLTVIGAGVIGVEYATIFSALDVRVTLIDPRSDVLGFVDHDIVQYLLHDLRERGVTLRLGHTVDKVTRDAEGRCICHLGGGRIASSDMVLFCAGRMGATGALELDKAGLEVDHRNRLKVDEFYRTDVPHIYAVGDVIGFPSLASSSMEQGRLAAAHAFDNKAPEPDKHIPYGIYAVPEISTVGMSEQEVAERGIPYEVGTARLRETARGQIMGLNSGMMKLIFSIKSHRLLGAHIVGEGATELIHVAQAVMGHKGKLDYFLENTFNYPTLAEAYKVAALDAWNRMPRDTSGADT